MRNALPVLLATGVVLGAAGAASAAPPATTTSTFTVSANVLKTCSVSATNLAFGNYTPGGGPVTSTSTVAVLCTNGTAFTAALNGGSTAGGTVGQRLMAESGGSGTLQYNLYTTSAHSTVWGDGTASTATQSGTGAGMAAAAAQNLTVFGQLPDSATNQAAPVTAATTAYSDTITVTVSY